VLFVAKLLTLAVDFFDGSVAMEAADELAPVACADNDGVEQAVLEDVSSELGDLVWVSFAQAVTDGDAVQGD
jgi:hypothetical protein